MDIPVLIDLHTHTLASGHYTSDTATMLAGAAASQGLVVLGITDHGPAMAGAASVSYFSGLRIAPPVRFGVRVLYGAELNILDAHGTVDLPGDVLAGLDFALAAMHPGVTAELSRQEVTAAYLAVMENPAVKVLAHCDDPRFPADYEAVVQAAAQSHVLVELNEASLKPCSYRGDTRQAAAELLFWCRKYRHPILLGSDSHGQDGVGKMPSCLRFLMEQDFPPELIWNGQPGKVLEFLGLPSSPA